MVRSSSLILGMVALPLWVGGCDSDFTILPDAGAVGVPNPPNLATPVKEDVIVQITTPEVDILWVIDNSGSMSEEQKKLKDNFGEFIKFFVDSGLDWHIGIVPVMSFFQFRSIKFIFSSLFKEHICFIVCSFRESFLYESSFS